MKFFQSLTSVALIAGLVAFSSFAHAAAPASSPKSTAPDKAISQPDPSANPVLATILKTGAKLYWLGMRSGLNGWFIVKDGHIQIIYGTSDNQAAIVGAMFGPNGESISNTQVRTLLTSNKELATLLTAAAAQSAPAPAPGAAAAPAASPATAALSPGERLVQDLSAASGVTVGSNASAPQLFMVMDPNCPHCQATWRALRDAVFKGNLQIRMIPIGMPDTDNERAAAQFLHVADPLNTWDKYVGGDKSQLAGTPDATLMATVRSNHALIDSWNIRATPYLVYHGKDGKVKIVQGEPDKIAAVLSDLAP